jgi:hypothetical protein
MRMCSLLVSVLGIGICLSATCRSEEPQKVSVCQLENDPAAYNHKLVEVEALVSHDFEDFTLFDPICHSSWPAVWLEYGGKFKSDTVYCCGPTNGRARRKELTIGKIPIPLVDDDQFRLFDKQIQPPFRSGKFGSIVHATIVGRFFAGEKSKYPNGKEFWGGYGHMGCCTLLAIQEIKWVDPQNRDDLDYGASYDNPDFDRVGCNTEELQSWDIENGVIHDQQQADRGEREWSFDDPQRVASDGLAKLAKIDAPIPLALTKKRESQGRIVFEWRKTPDSLPMTVVVSRPYVLSFFAKDPNRVAWVVAAAYRLSCGSDSSSPPSK